MKIILLHRSSSILSVFILLALTVPFAYGLEAFCTRVVDGDTIVVKVPSGKKEKVRLLWSHYRTGRSE